jgi:hypothetical protein
VLNEVDLGPPLGSALDFSSQCTSAPVNEDTARWSARVFFYPVHVPTKLPNVTNRRGVLFALHDNRRSALINEQNIHSCVSTTSTLTSFLKRIWEKAILKAMREGGNVARESVEASPRSGSNS